MNLIFDLFGTLVNRSLNPASIQRLNELISADWRAAYARYEPACDMGQMTQAEFWAKVQAELGVTEPKSAAELDKAILSTIDWLPGRKAILARLGLTNTLYLATNTRREWLEHLASRLQNGDEAIFSARACSFDLGVRKPHGLFFVPLVNALGDEPALYIDDDLANLKAAQAFGLRTMLADEFWGNA